MESKRGGKKNKGRKPHERDASASQSLSPPVSSGGTSSRGAVGGGSHHQRGESERSLRERPQHSGGMQEEFGSRSALSGSQFQREEFPEPGRSWREGYQPCSSREAQEEFGRRGDMRQSFVSQQSEAGRGRRQEKQRGGMGQPPQDRSVADRRGDQRDSKTEYKTYSTEQSRGSVYGGSGFQSQSETRGRGTRGSGYGRGRGLPPFRKHRDDSARTSAGGDSLEQVQLQKQMQRRIHLDEEEHPVKSLPKLQVQERGQETISEQTSVETQIVPSVKQTLSGEGAVKGSGFIIPHRKKDGSDAGTKGRKTQIEVNHFLLNLTNLRPIAVHYDVSFKPKASKRLCRAAVEMLRIMKYPKRFPGFDGRKNLYSCGRLPINDEVTETVTVYDEENSRDINFEVTVKFAAEVNMSQLISYGKNGQSQLPQDAIQVLDIVLRNPAAKSFVTVGRSFFTPPRDQVVELGNGLHLWYGFYQSAILGWKPYLNIDVAHKGFVAPTTLMNILLDFSNGDDNIWKSPLSREAMWYLESYLKGLKVEYEVPGQPNTKRTLKFLKIKDRCDTQRFQLDERTITIGEYFSKEKKYPLRFPKLPCIHVGNERREIFLPIELCRIPSGQDVRAKLNEKQTSVMVRNATKPPFKRKEQIMNSVCQIKFNTDECINEFGIKVNENFTKISARVLEPPELQYSDKKLVRPDLSGIWRGGRFLKAGEHLLNDWVILNLDFKTRQDSLKKLADLMHEMGTDYGVNIESPSEYKSLDLRGRPDVVKNRISSYFEDLKKGNKTKLIVVVIPNYPPPSGIDVYGTVKEAAECLVGILTQCVKSQTMYKINPSVVGHILLKINSKLNGINYVISNPFLPSILRKPIMVVGADVTHPAPGETNIPSIAAVAASHNPNAFSYNMLWRIQPPRCEIIEDLTEIMKQQLLFFRSKTGYKPEKIVFYRDGVGEGQFSQVLNVELNAIRKACMLLQEDDYKPGVTFLVVQKRHHTRFFPTCKQDENGKNKNVPPGTIVDSEITHPLETNFYLVSHASLQGTSRPTKYHKLWDDNDINGDDLEELTYYLCYMFSRCTRSVSYPAPTYYAHLAAFRAKSYLGKATINFDNLEHEQRLRTIQPSFLEQLPMFFV